jgi:hypothetical protein
VCSSESESLHFTFTRTPKLNSLHVSPCVQLRLCTATSAAFPVQVPRPRPRPSYITHIPSVQEQAGWAPLLQSPRSPLPLDFSNSKRPAPTRVRENVRLHQRLHHLFSFPLRHSLHTLVAIIHSLQVPATGIHCPRPRLHPLYHSRPLRATHIHLSIPRSRPRRRLVPCYTNLQLPEFSSLHTFSKSKPITPRLSTSRP